MWAAGTKRESLEFLRQFTASLSRDLETEASSTQPVLKQKMNELSQLLARCFYKQGEWQMAMKEDWGSVSIVLVYICYCISDVYSPEKYQGHSAILLACYSLCSDLVQSVAYMGADQLRGSQLYREPEREQDPG